MIRKLLVIFFEWLYFSVDGEKIIKIYSPVHFLIDNKIRCSRSKVKIIWNINRVRYLIKRFLLCLPFLKVKADKDRIHFSNRITTAIYNNKETSDTCLHTN